MQTGDKIEQLRKKHSMTKKELARRLGLKSQAAITRWINNTAQPSEENRVRLGQLFEKQADYFTNDQLTAATENQKIMEEIERKFMDLLGSAEDLGKNDILAVAGTVSGKVFDLDLSVAPMEYLPLSFKTQDGKKVFALKIETEDYSPYINNGEYVILAQSQNFISGKGLLIEQNGDYEFCKASKIKNGYQLCDFNNKPLKQNPPKAQVAAHIAGIFRKI